MKSYQLLLILLLFSLCGHAQRLYRKIATQEVNLRLEKEHPEVWENWRLIERQTAKYQKSEFAGEITLPVIFHIIHNNSEDRVSEAQVLSQIEALNRDFRHTDREIRHPADTLEGFADKAADTGISFCLAGETVTNSSTPGIHYVRSGMKAWKTDDAIKFSKHNGTDAMDPAHYINVWVANLDDGISGYAQMPGGPTETDGIVIDYRFFGIGGTSVPPYDEGKTLTHLMGNYLGLYDLWGNRLCGDDSVDDTPIHNAANFGCPGYKHISTCLNNSVEMTMNFMDNSDDACMYMFTQGQAKRMRGLMIENEYRLELVEYSSYYKTLYNGGGNEFNENSPKNERGLSVTVFPNPVSKLINIIIYINQESSSIISVFNPLGEAVYKCSLELVTGSQQMTIDCSSWMNGSYYVKVQTKSKNASCLFFVNRQ